MSTPEAPDPPSEFFLPVVSEEVVSSLVSQSVGDNNLGRQLAMKFSAENGALLRGGVLGLTRYMLKQAGITEAEAVKAETDRMIRVAAFVYEALSRQSFVDELRSADDEELISDDDIADFLAQQSLDETAEGQLDS
jgi:hypothetical protein